MLDPKHHHRSNLIVFIDASVQTQQHTVTKPDTTLPDMGMIASRTPTCSSISGKGRAKKTPRGQQAAAHRQANKVAHALPEPLLHSYESLHNRHMMTLCKVTDQKPLWRCDGHAHMPPSVYNSDIHDCPCVL